MRTGEKLQVIGSRPDGTVPSASAATGASAALMPRLLREAALSAVFLIFLAGYFVPRTGLSALAGGSGGPNDSTSGALASAYLALLFGAILTLAVRLLPGRGPAADEAGVDAAVGGRRRPHEH